MAKPKLNYTTADGSGWIHACDSLFLANFRGSECEMTEKTHEYVNGVKTRSMGHHLISKSMCRQHRYNPENIIVLNPLNHTRFSGHISPHSKSTCEQGLWWEWLRVNRSEKYEFAMNHYKDEFDGSWTYRDKYVKLGGKITDEKFKKDQKPLNHAQTVRDIEGKK